MTCDCAAKLHERAAELLELADTLDRDKRTRENAETTRRNAMALGYAAGQLRKLGEGTG